MPCRALLYFFTTLVGFTGLSSAVTIVSPPTFLPATNAPLAGLLQLATDVPARLSVSVDDGTGRWERNFYDYDTRQSVALAGFKPDRTNRITVTVHDLAHNALSASEPLVFVTGRLPPDFPVSQLVTNQPARMEPGYTLVRISNNKTLHAYVMMVDNSGEVLWYTGVPTLGDVRQLPNGDLFFPAPSAFSEINLLGETVRTWPAASNLLVNIHDGVFTPQNSILYLSDASRVETNFPTSATDPNAPLQTTNVLFNKVVEISADDAHLLNTWSPIDILDPRRLTYLTFQFPTALGWDFEHANALLEDPRDGSIIVSMRQQNAVIKFSRATGELKWILGPPENWGPDFQKYLLTPVGSPFQWNYAQHAPALTPQGTLLLYDDGCLRATPPQVPVADSQNYSRAVEFAIDETNMTVQQVWDYGRTGPERIFTPIVGNAQWLTNSGNVLVTFGYISFIDGQAPSPYSPSTTMVRIQEVTHEAVPEVVFDLRYFDYATTNGDFTGYLCYRSFRVADLYGHPPKPVADLLVQPQAGAYLLSFSADEARKYVVEASNDLVSWQAIGSPIAVGPGDFQLADNDSTRVARYYRVLTQ